MSMSKARSRVARPPSEAELATWKRVGRGRAALTRSLNAVLVPLEKDVAEEFPTVAEVNEALRLVKRIRDTGRGSRRRKTPVSSHVASVSRTVGYEQAHEHVR
jgi:hypothetical protein